jgi:hypothetical protein
MGHPAERANCTYAGLVSYVPFMSWFFAPSSFRIPPLVYNRQAVYRLPMKLLDLSTFDLSQAAICPPRKEAPHSSIVLPVTFPEATLYSLLRALFGRPAGAMSLLINPDGDPDAPFKYEFLIRLPDTTRLSFLRTWLNFEVRSYGRTITDAEIIKLITNNFNIHKKILDDSFNALESYRLLINPHYRHLRMMRLFKKELEAMNVPELEQPSNIVVEGTENQRYGSALREYLVQMERQSCFAVSLVTECAYAAESFLNLMLALLHNDVLRSNPKMFSEVLHENWRDKLERLPLHCRMITKKPDMDHTAVKSAKRLFELRNRIAHSYPDKDDLCVEKIWFDKRIPLLSACDSYVEYQSAPELRGPTRSEALEMPTVATSFIEYLKDLIDPRVKEEISAAAQAHPLGYSERTQRFGIPFGPDIFMSMMVKGNHPSENQ